MDKQQRLIKKQARAKAVKPFKGLSVFLGILFVVLLALSIVFSMFDNTLAAFAGGTFWELENADPNALYFKPDFKDAYEGVEYGKTIAKQVEAEGATLLTNKNGALPLSKGAKVSFVSNSSINPVYGGTGSGQIDAKTSLSFKDAFEGVGLKVNTTLWDWYSSKDIKKYKRDGGGFTSSAKTGEVPAFEYTDDIKNSISEYGDAAIFVLSRVGGEGVDLEFQKLNYLELDQNEKDVLKMLTDMKKAGKLKKIVVLLNTANTLEVDFLKDSAYDVDACLWIGDVGMAGIEAIADIFVGNTNPSGSLADTYLNDNFTSPAMKNFVATTYEGYEEGIIPSSASKYMIYQEGIYVGYKYYETRYEDFVTGNGNAGDYDYYSDVAFPFGYGLSYTTFEYSDFAVTYNAKTDAFDITVKVTNTGDKYEGKETVQIYAQSPYTEYDKTNGVEKSAVTLVGFAKTDILKPSQSEILEISVPRRELASFDAYGKGAYILEDGDYYLTCATSAHNAVNNVLAAKGYDTARAEEYAVDSQGFAELTYKYVQTEFDGTTYSKSATTDYDITAQLSMADLNLYEGSPQKITYLSRKDWVGTFPKGDIKLKLTDTLIKDLQNVQYAPADHPKVEMPVLGKEGDLKLIDLKGKAYDDPLWDKLLQQVTFEEMAKGIGDGFHWSMPMQSINAPGTRDENGPQGLTASLLGGKLKSSAFTSEDVMCATFNLDLMYEVGKCIGNDCLFAGVSKLYGTGANTHRTPYGGRNFEYYSEDGFLAGKICASETKGIESKGAKVLIKHFALNDSEQQRIGLGVWVNEQAARELYLKAYQATFEEADGNGVMLAYTRWGAMWSGGNYNLITNILRNEWGCEGAIITDNALDPYLNPADLVLAGGTFFDAMLPTQYNAILTYEDDPVIVTAMVEATHRNLYATVNSLGMNTVTANTTVKTVTPTIVTAMAVATVVSGVLFAVALYFAIVKTIKFNREYDK